MTGTNTSAPDTRVDVAFRWKYVILPVAILFVAAVLALVFYFRLPAEAAYRFKNGIPISWLGRGYLLVWALGLQAVFTLMALALTFMATAGARRMQMGETPLSRGLFSIMGNIVALPQIIFAYVMLDIFLYNANGTHLPLLWLFALAVMVLGGATLAVLFARALMQARKLKQ
jgi:hypothetical protein